MWVLSLGVLSLCGVSFDGRAAAQTTIHIATEQWPPYSYVDPQGKVVGISTERVKTMFKNAGIDYQIASYPWARAYHLALTQADTAVYTIKRTVDREALFQWVCPLQQAVPHYLFRDSKRVDIELTDLNEAKKYRIGVARNGFDQTFLITQGFVENINLDIATDDASSLRKMLNNRVDLVMGTKSSMYKHLLSIGYALTDLTVVLRIDEAATNLNCLAFNLKTDLNLVNKVRQALAALIESEVCQPLPLASADNNCTENDLKNPKTTVTKPADISNR